MSKDLGFTLTEIKEFLDIKIEQNGKCTLAFEKIQSKEAEIDSKINDLKKIKKALKKISERCKVSQGKESCHFLELIRN